MYVETFLLILAASSGASEVRFGGRYSLVETIRVLDSSETKDSVGYSVRGELSLEYLRNNLILAKIDPLKLHISSRKAPTPLEFVSHTSKLDNMENGPFLVQIDEGRVTNILLSKSEPAAMVNLKKGIASLFQFQFKSSTISEIDVSGECTSKYVFESDRIIKDKLNCKWPDQNGTTPEKLWGNKIESFRKTFISLGDHKTVNSIAAHEKHTTRSSLSSSAFLGVTADIELNVIDSGVNEDRLSSKDVNSVLIDVENENGLTFIQLTLAPDSPTADTNIMQFADVIDKFSGQLKGSELGTAKSSWALVKSLRSAKNTNAETLHKVLTSKKHKDIKPQLIDLFGAVQTNDTHQAALKFLQINTKKMDLDLTERYLWALSTSPNIKPHIVTEIYDMVKQAKHPDEKLWQTLVQTLPAMAYKYNAKCGHCNEQLIEDTVRFLNESINGCPPEDEACQTVYMRGLINIPTETMKTALIQKALTSKGRVGVVAMRFIEKLGASLWDAEVLQAAEQIYLGYQTYDSSARCIALDILLTSSPSDARLHRIISILGRIESSKELKEYLLQRLDEISDSDQELKKKFKRIFIEHGFNTYHHIAQGGFSTAFKRSFMEGGALSTTQEIDGTLKRGNVHINLNNDQVSENVFTLGLFSSGLSNIMSGGDDEDESATAGLELNVLGVGLRPFVFFNSQGDLIGHVWSGTASTLTPAFQALMLLEDEVVKIPLGIGYYASITTTVGASVDLSGKIDISIWNRNAEALVQNRAGLAFDSRIDIDTTFVKTTAEYNLFTEPELHLNGNMAFSGEVALCLQLQQPTSTLRFNTYRIERIPGSKHKLRKSRYSAIPIPGKTYALNAKNNEMCNAILSE